MKKSGTLRSQAGFSLVELMVVVAIIGVLAAMSAGQVQKQIAKARQSEAKTNLATLWSAEEAFKAEYNSYTSDFVAAKLAYNGRLYYHVGFNANHVASGGIAGYTGTSNTSAFNTSQTPATTCPGCVMMAGAGVYATTAMTASAYTAGAQGQPMSGVNDQWTINNTKNLIQPAGGDGIQ